MQTLTVNIQDNFVQDFLTIIDHYKDKVSLEKNVNLEYDPYYYERQKDLQQTFEEISSGSMPTHNSESSMDELIKELEN